MKFILCEVFSLKQRSFHHRAAFSPTLDCGTEKQVELDQSDHKSQRQPSEQLCEGVHIYPGSCPGRSSERLVSHESGWWNHMHLLTCCMLGRHSWFCGKIQACLPTIFCAFWTESSVIHKENWIQPFRKGLLPIFPAERHSKQSCLE